MAEATRRQRVVGTRGQQADREKELTRIFTDYLFARPSFWSGVASVFDLFGRLDQNSYNYSRTEEEADRRGLYTDYYTVGQDFWKALRMFESELPYDKRPQQDRLFDPDEVERAS